MKMKFDERDYGYTIISRFESEMRNCIISKKEISTDWKNNVPEGVIKSAKEKTDYIDEFEDFLENIDFIHLKEIIIYKNNYKLFFDSLIMHKEEFIKDMDGLYELRNRISHVRQYYSLTDLNLTISAIHHIISKINYDTSQICEFIDNVLTAPEKLVNKIPVDFITEESILPVINNLPQPDYELDGGYVGRSKDKHDVIEMIKKDMHKVITISGAGGVGKTAFVLNLVYEIINKKIIEYDYVVWVSAKETKLTHLGIEDIEPTLKNYEELLNTILKVTGFENDAKSINECEKEKLVNDIFSVCDKVLLIIDNLETINDERIINFILDPHPSIRFIITSRKGLGQVERRYELRQLEEADAITLFKVICQNRQQKDLINIGDNIIKQYVNKTYRYPLAIKWTIAQVNNGKDINEIINQISEQNTDISKFCFEQIFMELSYEEKYILYILSMYEEPIQKGTIKFISDFKEEVCFDSISTLQLLSLIIPEDRINDSTNEIVKYYSLMPLTRGFILSKMDEDVEIKKIIQEKIMQKDIIIEEAQKAQSAYKYSLSNFGANTEEEKIAAVLCQSAFQQYQSDNYDGALELYKRASNIAPKLSSIYRNWAIMESNEGHLVHADELMGKATKLSPNDVQIWLVWGNMKRKTDKIIDAQKYYKKAYDLSPNDVVVKNSYAQAESRLGNYELAHNLLVSTLNDGENREVNRHKIINYTSISENLLKWSEALKKDRNIREAINKSEEALKYIRKIYFNSTSDEKSKKVYLKSLYNTAKLYYINKDYNKSQNVYCELLSIKYYKFYEKKLHVMGVIGLAKVLVNLGNKIEAKKYLKTIEKDVYSIDSAFIDDYKKTLERLNS